MAKILSQLLLNSIFLYCTVKCIYDCVCSLKEMHCFLPHFNFTVLGAVSQLKYTRHQDAVYHIGGAGSGGILPAERTLVSLTTCMLSFAK